MEESKAAVSHKMPTLIEVYRALGDEIFHAVTGDYREYQGARFDKLQAYPDGVRAVFEDSTDANHRWLMPRNVAENILADRRLRLTRSNRALKGELEKAITLFNAYEIAIEKLDKPRLPLEPPAKKDAFARMLD